MRIFANISLLPDCDEIAKFSACQYFYFYGILNASRISESQIIKFQTVVDVCKFDSRERHIHLCQPVVKMWLFFLHFAGLSNQTVNIASQHLIFT